MTESLQDSKYCELLLAPLRKCADYRPKMGGQDNVDVDQFTILYGDDPLYHWMGLDSPLMYAAHKAAGGMTSVYRQLGIGCERLFRQILRDQLGLAAEQVKWAYEYLPEPDPDQPGKPLKSRKLELDGRVDLNDVQDAAAKDRISQWVQQQQALLDISTPLKGAVFEVRQGYKSADSKRQNGDLANAAQALGHGYLPVLVIMSTQINHAVRARYMVGNWSVLMGTVGQRDAQTSTYSFLDDVVGYDLPAFFERNTALLRQDVEKILKSLLEPK
ncbi:hypothetical protein ACTQ49_05755 [Luteococcus sp. Sow4_B9]|uniref:hypothetical protein n=1 Tax=Luteococcus sp. Sow4_B9 TaxID=3438792 RepID=UPI003F98279C